MFFLRKLIGRLLFVTVLGFVIRKLRASSDPRAQRFGDTANKVLGGAFGVSANGQVAKPRGRMRNSAGSAAVGGLMSYFFDPAQGADRRARAKNRAKNFAKERFARAQQRPMLPSHATPIPSPAIVQSRSNIV